MNILLQGGPADGKEVAVLDGTAHFTVAVSPPLALSWSSYDCLNADFSIIPEKVVYYYVGPASLDGSLELFRCD